MTASRVTEIEAAIGGGIVTQLEKQKRGELPPGLPGPTVRNPFIAPAIILALVFATSIIAVAFGRYAMSSHGVGSIPSVVILDRLTGVVRHCELGQQECVVLRDRRQP